MTACWRTDSAVLQNGQGGGGGGGGLGGSEAVAGAMTSPRSGLIGLPEQGAPYAFNTAPDVKRVSLSYAAPSQPYQPWSCL